MEKTKKINSYLLPASILIAGVLVAGALFLTQDNDGDDSSVNDSNEILEQEDFAPQDASVELDGWPYIGDTDAPVVLVEYSDFSCPFCARFWEETLPSIKEDYIDTGKVRFVYKDFAVVGGERAAEAAHCAAEQDSFWEYHDLLFERHGQDSAQWSDASVHEGYAQKLGLNAGALVECFEERRYQDKVDESTQEAIQNGGQGTPYFVINEEEFIGGAQPYSVFQTALDLVLENE